MIKLVKGTWPVLIYVLVVASSFMGVISIGQAEPKPAPNLACLNLAQMSCFASDMVIDQFPEAGRVEGLKVLKETVKPLSEKMLTVLSTLSYTKDHENNVVKIKEHIKAQGGDTDPTLLAVIAGQIAFGLDFGNWWIETNNISDVDQTSKVFQTCIVDSLRGFIESIDKAK